MQHWDVTWYTLNFPTVGIGPAWQEHFVDPGSGWEKIKQMSSEGWELVAITPIQNSGTIWKLMYTFKRPKQDM